MREMEFRVWSEDQKTYNYKFPYNSIGDFYVSSQGIVYSDFGNTIAPEVRQKSFIVEPCAGLKDKNGKKIYRGDIVEALIDGAWATGKNSVGFGKAKWKLEVIHNDIRFMDVFRVIGSKNCPDRIYYLFDKELSELEVIGNIHENPELLDKEEE